MTNQRVDEWGRVILSEKGLLELFYKGLATSSDLMAEDNPAIKQYNEWCKTFDGPDKQVETFAPIATSPVEYHKKRQEEWIIDSDYLELDVEQWLFDKCKTQAQVDRVRMELDLFKEHNMYRVLQLLIYVTDTLRQNHVWWGVGRGSSVASYCLFLIGVHRVDSLKFDLDIREFIKP